MRIDFKQFEGTLPYDSQMYGVYQPLLGWKSAQQTHRLLNGLQFVRQKYLGSLTRLFTPNYSVGDVTSDTASFQVRIATLTSQAQPRSIEGIDSLIVQQVASAAFANNPADPDSWKRYSDPAFLDKTLGQIGDKIKAEFSTEYQRQLQNRSPVSTARLTNTSPATILSSILQRESVSAGVLAFLNQTQSAQDLQYLLTDVVRNTTNIHAILGQLNPAQSELARAALSPIGIVHLFRQYFFEFATFLGSPTQHIWLSPGGTVELIEISTRKRTVERTLEQALDSIRKSDKESTNEDDLSTAIKSENSSDTKLGVSATSTTNYTTGFVSGSVSVTGSLNLDQQQKQAREQTHKTTLQQTQKLSSEIRQSYKSTFKTVTENTDTTNKRYVLSNTTDKLVNYELRRKMRQIGVQMQDYGTRLCWQTFVDNPGDTLGVPLFVHVADLSDLQSLKDPDNVPEPEPVVRGQSISLDLHWRMPDERQYHFVPLCPPITVVPPSPGYIYDHCEIVIQSGPGWGIFAWPSAPADGQVTFNDNSVHSAAAEGYTLQIDIGDGVNKEPSVTKFIVGVATSSGGIKDDRGYDWTVQATPIFKPSQSLIKNVHDTNLGNQKKATEERRQAFQQALFQSIRDRVKLASNIQERNFSDLREEERIVVYRNLVRQLLQVAGINTDEPKVRHVFSELIESMFDMDNMLYFVAPDWWMPRDRVSAADSLAGLGISNKADEDLFGSGDSSKFLEADVVTWGGAQASRRQNYYITDDSTPAKLGSSLGWLLQLDGDNFRNAFLNAPWVKAVIPIREGHEWQALEWLSTPAIEGSDGLDALYQESFPGERADMLTILKAFTNWPDPKLTNRYSSLLATELTILDALRYLVIVIQKKQTAGLDKVADPADPTLSYLPTDKVYEHGFDPLQGGFVAQPETPFEIFDQWVDILPTDQIVPVEVTYDGKTGLQI